MDIETIKVLIETFSDSPIHKMELEIEGLKLLLEKPEVVSKIYETSLPTHVSEIKESQTISNIQTEAEVSGHEVKAPLVGVYYAKSDPQAAPYVQVGDHVEKGQTLCIIEAMKVMNEIHAPISGTILEIRAENEQLVEYDQVLMVIGG